LVDLRSPLEFRRSSLAGAMNIPYTKLPDSIDQLSTEKEIVLICNDGYMAGAARNFLKGYAKMQNVLALESGFTPLSKKLSAKKAG